MFWNRRVNSTRVNQNMRWGGASGAPISFCKVGDTCLSVDEIHVSSDQEIGGPGSVIDLGYR